MNMRIVLQLLALAATLLAGAAQAAVTVTLQQGSDGYAGTQDTFISAAAPTTNYGGTWDLQELTPSRAVLVRFAIFQSEGGPLPNGATIQSATLSLYKSSGGITTYGAHRVLKTWNETQATWNDATSALAWTAAGATGSGSDISATSDGTGTTTDAAGWLDIPVTGGVAAMAAGASNHGWRLVRTAGAASTKSFRSRNYTPDISQRPKLTITYETATVPAAPAIGTATAGDAQATVSFTPPPSDGGSLITGYTVTSSPGNLTATGTASPLTVTGLTNGTAYTFTVEATNAIGTGPASAPSNSVMPTAPLTDAQTLYFVHPDHLGTPRLITNAQGTPVWVWDDTESFGNSAPNPNPAGTGPNFTYNLRFPGQYYDAETGLHYNTFRDYDPVSGRYVQSDPIGLEGGINPYAYVGNNPLAYVDPLGLVRWEGAYELSTAGLSKFGAGYAGVGGTFTLMSDCVAGVKGMAQVRVKGSGFGYGGSLLGFFSIGTSTVKFEDGLSFVDPDIFNGAFYMESIGTVFYSSTANFRLGGAVGDGSGFGIATDIYSVYGANGESTVINKKLMACDCPKP